MNENKKELKKVVFLHTKYGIIQKYLMPRFILLMTCISVQSTYANPGHLNAGNQVMSLDKSAISHSPEEQESKSLPEISASDIGIIQNASNSISSIAKVGFPAAGCSDAEKGTKDSKQLSNLSELDQEKVWKVRTVARQDLGSQSVVFTLESPVPFPELTPGTVIKIKPTGMRKYFSCFPRNGGLQFAVAGQPSSNRIEILVNSKNADKIKNNLKFMFKHYRHLKMNDLASASRIHIFSQGVGAGVSKQLINFLIRKQGISGHKIVLWQSVRAHSELPDWDNQYLAWEKEGVKIHRITSRESSKFGQGVHVNSLISDKSRIRDEDLFVKDGADVVSSAGVRVFAFGSPQYLAELGVALESRGYHEPIRSNW